MKKVFSVFMALALIFVMIPAGMVTTSAEVSGDYSYYILEGEAILYAYTGTETNITIPGELGGCPVTIIDGATFEDNETIISVIIPDSVIFIYEYAFYGCTKLTRVIFGAGVKSIGANAFNGCTALVNITIPESVETFGYYAFYGTPWLENYPNDLVIVGNHVLIYSKSIEATSAAIPSDVKFIATDAFTDCSKVTEFIVDENNEKYSSKNGIIFNKLLTSLTLYPLGKTGAYTVPNTVTSIEPYAFAYNPWLTGVTIGDSVKTIGEFAFYNCKALAQAVLGINIETINNYAFYNCTALTAISIPGSLGEIGVNVFAYCTNLTNLTIQNGVRVIGDSAFRWCLKLTVVIIPTSVTNIGAYSFADCTGLTGITLGENVEKIGDGAFNTCSVLQSIVIPNKVVSFGNYTFANCLALSSVSLGDSITAIGNNAFADCPKLVNINIPNKVTSIGSYAFKGCGGLTGVSIGNSVTILGDGAFMYCGNLTTIELPPSVKSIGIKAFYLCGKLTGIGLPFGITSIGTETFYSCALLKNVNIPNSVTNIGHGAFVYCSGLTGIVVPDSVTLIDDYAFYKCTALANIIIGNGVTHIGLCAFYNCTGLKNVEIGSSVNYIEKQAFYGSYGLTSAHFFGIAPTMETLVFDYSAATFKVYYLSTKTGFTNPWYGYTTVAFTPLTLPVFEPSTVLPTNSDVTVTVTYPAEATAKEYKVGLGAWTAYTAPVVLIANDTVYARCRDAGANISKTVSVAISNIDKLNKFTGSTTIINNGNHFILGLKPGITKMQFENNYVRISGNARLDYTPNLNSLGTGTKVELIDNITNEVVTTYSLVIFGDVNGDGNVDSMDAGTAVDVENDKTDWTPGDNAAQYLAGDINLDGNVDSLDAGLMVDYENAKVTIDQTTGKAA